jgi:hypothetical protein
VAGPILTEQTRISDGRALTPERAGNGLEWNEDWSKD